MPREVAEAVDKLLQELFREISVDEAYVFGSYVRGDWIKTSDIDLVIASRDFKNMRYLDRLDLV